MNLYEKGLFLVKNKPNNIPFAIIGFFIGESTTFVKYCFKFNIRRLFQKIFNKTFLPVVKTIIVFGDSHSVHGWENISIPYIDIRSHHIGPRLMYSFGRDGLKLLDISDQNYGVKNGDIVCFSFGEIDCRCQVHKYVNDSVTYQEIIDSLCENYFLAIQKNTKDYNILHVCIYNILPPTSLEDFPDDLNFPRLGSNDERKDYHDYMNKQLRVLCKEFDYTFIDVYKQYANNKGFLNKFYSDGTVHISNPIYLEKEIRKYLI